jgi:hypothetical protein
MTLEDPSGRGLYALEPRGADLSPGMFRTLAQGGGTLVGAIVNGLVRTWVADNDGQLTLVMWPENFRARLDCQWPSDPPQLRPWFLPAGGHRISPLMAMVFPQGGHRFSPPGG